jgi:hypothetical protein
MSAVRFIFQGQEHVGGRGELGATAHNNIFMYLANLSIWNCLLHKCNHIRGEGAVAMILLVGLGSLGTGQALTISGNKPCGPVCKSAKECQSWNKRE